MCEEIILHRYDDTPWGFRLTGGHDFGIPLTVVRVTGGSLAEEAGMCVGDMIIEINGDPTAQITHSDAQQYILEAGNTVNLSILRGSPVPAVTPTRCLYTPSAMERATSSVGSIAEHESSQNYGEIHNYRDNVVSAASSGYEMTEEEIAEKLLESAEVIENNGKKRHRNSLVFQTLQEEQIFDEKSEQDQLKKCPTKRFSTFLTTPNRPRIKPPEKKKPEEVKKQPEAVETIVDSTESTTETKSCDKVCTNCKCKMTDIEDMVTADKSCEKDEVTKAEEDTSVAEQQSSNEEEERNEEDLDETVNEDVEQDEEIENMDVETEESAEKPQETPVPDIVENENEDPENEFVKSVQNIQNQLNTIRQLPLQIQNHIALLEKQLSELLSKKINSAGGSEGHAVAENGTGRRREDSWVKVDEEGREEEYDYEEAVDEAGVDETDDGVESSEKDEGGENKETAEEEQQQDNDSEQTSDDKEPAGRPVYPLTPLPRPIVLPGGRKWRCPKDAYNEEFIAETLISQAEVLVGSAMGVNFRKYEPPKFDVSNSAVYKLVHNIESKNTRGIENRPEKVSAEEDFYYHKPIDARQFYLATLPQPPIVPDFENESQHGH